jgi:hypothetical protein
MKLVTHGKGTFFFNDDIVSTQPLQWFVVHWKGRSEVHVTMTGSGYTPALSKLPDIRIVLSRLPAPITALETRDETTVIVQSSSIASIDSLGQSSVMLDRDLKIPRIVVRVKELGYFDGQNNTVEEAQCIVSGQLGIHNLTVKGFVHVAVYGVGQASLSIAANAQYRRTGPSSNQANLKRLKK